LTVVFASEQYALFTSAVRLGVGRSENMRISYLQVKNNSISEDGRNQAMND